MACFLVGTQGRVYNQINFMNISRIHHFWKRCFHTSYAVRADELTYLNTEGKTNMIDISGKHVTPRKAVAQCTVKVTGEIMSALIRNETGKGDAISVSRIAGIQAAKLTSMLIPLCHSIQLTVDKNEVQIRSLVRTDSKTGAEMEALTAVAIAGLTLYDMCKSISHEMIVTGIRLLGKSGGKSTFGQLEL